MNRVEFVFEDRPFYALYDVLHLDGIAEYYLELRDRDLIKEFGLGIRFKRDHEGHLQLTDTGTLPGTGPQSNIPRKKELIKAILLSIDRQTASLS